MQITTQNLQFIEISKKDIPIIHKLHSIPEVDKYNTLGIPKNNNETEKLLTPYFNQSKDKTMYAWLISLSETKTTIGFAGMHLSGNRFKMAEFYYKFFPEFWGNGYGTQVCKLLLNVGFKEFNLHKIDAGVATENIASVRVLEKSGMIREGLRRKILPIRGNWVDNYHYSLVEDDNIPEIDYKIASK